MKTIEATLRDEQQRLEIIVKEARKRNETAPEGQLRIMNKRNNLEYYYKDKDSKLRYMKKSERHIAQRIAQRDYDVRVIKRAQRRIKAIELFLRVYDRTCLKKLYQETNPYRRELIVSPIISDEEYIRQWQAVEYDGKSFCGEENEIVTDRGERVRSKSEKIIADKLYSLGIPYRYEYPLMLEGNIRVYPDFTILKMPERKEVYLEHFGLMGDVNYVDSVLYKLGTYERNGIYLGVNLFVTYETGKRTLNTRNLDQIIRELFL